MKVLGLVLVALLVLIQYPLWLGKGGWLRVWDLDRQVTAQLAANAGLRARNAALQAEVDDLREGRLAIEERARYELGMVRPEEIFVRITRAAVPASTPVPGNATPVSGSAAVAPGAGAANAGAPNAGASNAAVVSPRPAAGR